jgi:glycosyltransferase involved in cell wall biosynthesis
MRRAAVFALRHSDFLRAVSNSTREQLEHWRSEKPIIQFPAWTDIEVFLQAGGERNGSQSQEIIYVGVLIPRKGVHHLINAFTAVASDFPSARLVIVGNEENKVYAAELKEQVRRLGFARRVQFLRAMPQADLADWMRRASVCVLPSVSEGLGRVVIEAMATGTPVIGSNVGGIPEMVKDGTTGLLVPPGDETALAEKIGWVLSHSEETQVMGRSAQIFAEGFFSTEVYVAAYRQLFEAAQALIADSTEDVPSPV